MNARKHEPKPKEREQPGRKKTGKERQKQEERKPTSETKKGSELAGQRSCFDGDLAAAFQLHLEDYDVAAWMTITNSFVPRPYKMVIENGKCVKKYGKRNLWEGVLVQWGDFIKANTDDELQNVFLRAWKSA